jgi:hypothetical protein
MEHKISANWFDSFVSFSPKNVLEDAGLLDEGCTKSIFGGCILLVRYATTFEWLLL